jgi:hypothetical protein
MVTTKRTGRSIRRAAPDVAAPLPPALVGRMVRLATGPDGGRLVVEPAVANVDGGNGRSGGRLAFAAFALPRVPVSTLRWCAAVAERFRDDHGACLGLALVLDRRARRWSPLIPTQVASGRAVRLALAASDLAHLPAHVLVAGSFQSRGAGDPFDAAAAAVPAFGGVHLVECRARPRGRPASFVFVRGDAAQEPQLADPASVLVDDLDQSLRDAVASGRLRVE